MSFDSSDEVDSDPESEDENLLKMKNDKPIGPRLEDFYEVGKEIGRRVFATVYEGIDKSTGKKVAIKAIQKRYIYKKLLNSEIDVLKKVGDHPNILKIYDVYETKNFLLLVLEFASGGVLYEQFLAREEHSEKDISYIIRQIVSAFAHLHANGITHKFKPDNILCVGDSTSPHIDIKVADFGFSDMFDQGEYQVTQCDNPEYTAPEVLECKPYNKTSDMWAVGILTYFLLTGSLPFWDRSNAVFYEKIRSVTYSWPDSPEVSPEAKDLVRHLIEKNPAKRYTAEQALEHAWLAGHGVSDVKLQRQKF